MSHALTVNDLPQVHVAGSRLNGLLDIVKKLADLNIDLSSLTRLISLLGEIGTAQTTKDKVVASLEALRILSQITPTETDDKIVEAVTTILSGKTLDVLCALVDSWLGNKSLALDAYEPEILAAGFDRSMFTEIARLVLALIRSR